MKLNERIGWLILFYLITMIVLLVAPPSNGQQMSALVGQAMDKQLSMTDFNFNGTLPQAIQNFGDMTGVRIEADNAVYNALPWGDLTTFSAKFQHETLRQALGAICEKLGMDFEITDTAVELHPMPALTRLGRRATVDELAELDFLRQTPLGSAEASLPADRWIGEIDQKLKGTPYAIQDRAFTNSLAPTIKIARNATLVQALEEISLQTNATWYPWGNTIIVLNKPEQIRMQLTRRITTRFAGQDVNDVLLELARQSGVLFQIDPGAIQRLPAESRLIKLSLDNATIQQAIESISGYTGLEYSVTNEGVRISFQSTQSSPTTQPITSR